MEITRCNICETVPVLSSRVISCKISPYICHPSRYWDPDTYSANLNCQCMNITRESEQGVTAENNVIEAYNEKQSQLSFAEIIRRKKELELNNLKVEIAHLQKRLSDVEARPYIAIGDSSIGIFDAVWTCLVFSGVPALILSTILWFR